MLDVRNALSPTLERGAVRQISAIVAILLTYTFMSAGIVYTIEVEHFGVLAQAGRSSKCWMLRVASVCSKCVASVCCKCVLQVCVTVLLWGCVSCPGPHSRQLLLRWLQWLRL